jgi:hypothetical protein
LTSAVVGDEWSASRLCRFTLRDKVPGTRWIGGWVGSRTGLDHMEKRKFLSLSELELRPLIHPARSQSLYRLSYCGFLTIPYIAYKTLQLNSIKFGFNLLSALQLTTLTLDEYVLIEKGFIQHHDDK